MDKALQAMLSELFEQGRANDRREQERGRKMLNLDQETASLVSLLLRASRRRSLLEIGTSNGYSTIWLAAAMRETGGRLTSIDRDGAKLRLAAENLRRAALHEEVDLCEGEATSVVSELAGPFDAVFFDADRLSAPDQLERLLPKLTSDALLLADNALSHPDEIAPYLRAVSSLADFESLVVPIGKGLSVAYRSSK